MVEPLVLGDLLRIDPVRLAWQPFHPGVEIHRLYQQGERGQSAAFLRYAPGARVPRHRHVGFEHIYVLSGAQEDERGHYPAGTFLINPPGSAHSVRSLEGCLVLATWECPVELL